MSVSVASEGEGRFIISCPEELEWDARVNLVEALRQTVNAGKLRSVILDLGGVKYINSAGLGAIFSLRKYAQTAGAAMIVARPGLAIQRLLDTVNLPALVPVAKSLEEAREKLLSV